MFLCSPLLFVAVISLLFCTATAFLRPSKEKTYPTSKYAAHDFVAPISCVDEGFDMDTYLTHQSKWIQTKFTNPEQLPRFMQELVHIFAAAGKRCDYLSANTSITNYDPDGCFPFQSQVLKFRNLDQCLSTNLPKNPAGHWMNRPGPKHEFWKFRNTPSERIMYRLSLLEAKAALKWDTDDSTIFKHSQKNRFIDDSKNRTLTGILSESFNDEEIADGAIVKVLSCMNKARITRGDFKCRPALFGSPGYEGLTLFDHHAHAYRGRYISRSCRVPPTCMRLAFERLHHFQSLKFDKLRVNGIFKYLWYRQGRPWVNVNGEIKSETCNIKPDIFGYGICWNYTSCVHAMMRQICSERNQCCPEPKVHEVCKKDLGHKDCRICTKVPGVWF